MGEFLTALVEFEFLRTALIAGVLASVACGVIGTYVVVRRISYIASGIAHCVLGGIGAAHYAQVAWGWQWLDPMIGAVIAALVSAAVIGLVSLHAKQREDTVISALYAIGMAVGVLCIAKTPGYASDLQSYLFGNILLVAERQLWIIVALDMLVLTLVVLLFNQFAAICFDEEFSRLRRLPVDALYLLLLGLTALTVVVLASIVGIILVIALLALPVAVATHFARTLLQTMVIASVLSMLFTGTGLALSYGPNLPAGPIMIVLAGGAYLAVTAGAWALGGRKAARAPLSPSA